MVARIENGTSTTSAIENGTATAFVELNDVCHERGGERVLAALRKVALRGLRPRSGGSDEFLGGELVQFGLARDADAEEVLFA